MGEVYRVKSEYALEVLNLTGKLYAVPSKVKLNSSNKKTYLIETGNTLSKENYKAELEFHKRVNLRLGNRTNVKFRYYMESSDYPKIANKMFGKNFLIF